MDNGRTRWPVIARRSAMIVVTIACGALCGALLGFPLAARFAALAPLTLFPLLYAYQTQHRSTCIWLTSLFNASMLLVALEWIYGGVGPHEGVGAYYESAIALLFQCIPYALVGFVASYFKRLSAPQWCVAIASVWTLCEYWRSISSLGHPYVQLGHALIDTPLVALARIGGTETLTFACVLVAAVLYRCSRHAPKIAMAAWLLYALAITSNAVMYNTDGAVARHGDTVAVFQLGEVDKRTLATYLKALRERTGSPAFAVWPESNLTIATAMYAIRSSVRMRGVPLLVGGTVTDASGYHDALVFVDRDGSVKGYYAKRHLIPFGEFLPLPALAHVLIPPSISALVPHLSPGRGPVVFRINEHAIGPLICYESAFPGLARDEVRIGANLLAVATDDAWFTGASGLWELKQTARLVSIETGTPMILSGTVGPSGVINANGRWTGELPVSASARADFSIPHAHWTLYDTIGDTPWLLTIAVLGLCAVFTSRRR